MPKYLVNSHILDSETSPSACAEGAAKMLAKGKIKDIEAKSCFWGGAEKRVAFIIEGPSKDAVLGILQEQLNIPIASIMEIEEVKH